MNKRLLAILAATAASTIYGINHTVAKNLMPEYIQPFGFILLRVVGAAILFWLISFWGPKEKIATSDWPRILGCTIFGMVINMLLFFKGLSMTTPINSSVIITITPILVLILAAVLIRERITVLKTAGIIIGLAGAVSLILFGKEQTFNAPNIPLGNLLVIVNAFSYGLYLILVKPLTSKYHPFTIMKWLFLLAVIINLPLTLNEFLEVEWTSLSPEVMGRMAFVVVGTTFLTYLLNVFALRQLSAATISAFIYLQPLIAIIYAVATGADTLNLTKIAAAILVFAGVYMVTRKPKPVV
ncbi:DMT family transporter [Salinimicrobium soli]|uniref:DMT family transporter n=1 Tax=Salinimicrobium soli TaxID=1254399 RepID=UPI003AAF4020